MERSMKKRQEIQKTEYFPKKTEPFKTENKQTHKQKTGRGGMQITDKLKPRSIVQPPTHPVSRMDTYDEG